jgi:type VI protein secretion system component VasK
MDNPEYAARRRAESNRQAWWFVGVVVAVNAVYWTWELWPAQTFEKCMVKMAEKAQGNDSIFRALAHANCKGLPRKIP